MACVALTKPSSTSAEFSIKVAAVASARSMQKMYLLDESVYAFHAWQADIS